MLLSTADIVAKIRPIAGGQHLFSLSGITDLKKKAPH